MPGDDSAPALGLGKQRLDLRERMDRITEDDRAMKLPLKDGEKCDGVDARCLAASSPVAMARPSSPWATGRPKTAATGRGMIDMQRIEISGEAREQDDIGFGDGSPWAFPLVADQEIIK